MVTSVPEKVTARLRRWEHLDRVIAAVIGAAVVVLAYVVVTVVVYPHTSAFQRRHYMDGYELGELLRDVDSHPACGTIVDTLYDFSRDDYGSYKRSGGRAFVQGCVAAVEGKPADPSDADL